MSKTCLFLVVLSSVPALAEQTPEAIAEADAAFQKLIAKANQQCGISLTGRIDWPTFKEEKSEPITWANDEHCGLVVNVFGDLCKDDAGKKAAAAVTTYECQLSTGKANTPTTQVVHTANGKRETWDFTKGKLTVGVISDPSYWWELKNHIVKGAFPSVAANRWIDEYEKKEQSGWERLTQDLGLTLERVIDRDAFTPPKVPNVEAAKAVCGANLYSTLRSLDANPNGKKLLKKLKKVKCTASSNDKALSSVEGDTLHYVGTVKAAFGGDTFQISGTLDGDIYNQLRKTLKLGGNCISAAKNCK
jgi:hypothetical protein